MVEARPVFRPVPLTFVVFDVLWVEGDLTPSLLPGPAFCPELLDEAAALRLELPTRSAAAIADILWHRHGVRVAERTLRAQLRRRGLHREAVAAEPKAFGRDEAARPNIVGGVPPG